MIPTDVLRVVAAYEVEPVYRLRSGLTWSDGLLSNPLAADRIREFLRYHEITSREVALLARNTNPEMLEYVDVTKSSVVRELCGNWSAKAIEMLRHIPVYALHWDLLSANPYAIELLAEHPQRVCWRDAAENPAAYELIKRVWLEENMDCWDSFYVLKGIHSKKLFQEIPHRFPETAVYNATPLFEERLRLFDGEGISMTELCAHPDRLQQVEQLPMEEWTLEGLAENPNPEVVPMIQRYVNSEHLLHSLEDVAWILSDCRHQPILEMAEASALFPLLNEKVLSRNPAAIDLLVRNREKVDWQQLAKNPSSRAIEVVMAHLPSFLASESRDFFYARPEVLELDVIGYQKRVEEFVSKVKIF